MNKKSIREILLIINDAFQFLVGVLILIAAIVVTIYFILTSLGSGISLAFNLIISPFYIVLVLLPLILLGIISFIPVLFGIKRHKAEKEKLKHRFLILNIVGLFICTILTFAGSFGAEYLISDVFGGRYSLSFFEIIILLTPIIMLILNILLLLSTIYIEIPTVTDQNDDWKDYS